MEEQDGTIRRLWGSVGPMAYMTITGVNDKHRSVQDGGGYCVLLRTQTGIIVFVTVGVKVDRDECRRYLGRAHRLVTCSMTRGAAVIVVRGIVAGSGGVGPSLASKHVMLVTDASRSLYRQRWMRTRKCRRYSPARTASTCTPSSHSSQTHPRKTSGNRIENLPSYVIRTNTLARPNTTAHAR